jgi:hypothetical protein
VEHEKVVEDLQRQLNHVKRTAEGDIDRIRKRTESEILDLKSSIRELQIQLEKVATSSYFTPSTFPLTYSKANKNHLQDLQTAHDEFSSQLQAQALRLQRADERAKDSETQEKLAHERISKVRQSRIYNCYLADTMNYKVELLLNEKETQRAAAQNELDDMLMVFADLEEKAASYKV